MEKIFVLVFSKDEFDEMLENYVKEKEGIDLPRYDMQMNNKGISSDWKEVDAYGSDEFIKITFSEKKLQEFIEEKEKEERKAKEEEVGSENKSWSV